MTMPHLMNCGHSGTGWCLDCVKDMYDENELELSETLKDSRDIIGVVRDMRNAQKKYFRTRSSEALDDSKELERTVDARIDAFLDTQGKLF